MSIENVTPKFSKKPIKIVGCGLAGAEIAFILANNGFDVHIFDNELYVPKDKFDYWVIKGTEEEFKSGVFTQDRGVTLVAVWRVNTPEY